MLAQQLLKAMGEPIESLGKGALIGLNGDAMMSFLRTTTRDNRGCGIYAEVYSDYGDADLSGESVVSGLIRQDGVQTQAALDDIQ